MARIPDDVLKQWRDDEKIDANQYTAEREVLRVAVNDVQDQVDDLKQNSGVGVDFNNFMERSEADSTYETIANVDSMNSALAARVTQNEKDITEIPIDKATVGTTAGRSWSTTGDELTHNLNGEDVSFRTAPKVLTRKLVVFGSSTSEGFYATEGNAWVDLLKLNLAPKGWAVLERGLSADNTTGAIARFYKDVAVYKPDACLIAFTFGNEGMSTTQTQAQKETTYNQFRDNLLAIALLCKQNGIVPIIVDQSPTKNYDAEIYRLASQLNKEIDSLGFYTVNFKGAIDAMTADGQPLNLAMYDNLHPNNEGHNAMFRAIPPSSFKYLVSSASLPKIESKKGVLRTPATWADTDIPIQFTPADPIETFTIFFRIKSTATRADQRTWAGIGNSDLRISNQGTNAFLDMRGTAVGLATPIISTTNLNDLLEHSVTVSFNKISKVLKLYTDGVLVNSATITDVVMDNLYLAGRPAGVVGINAEFRDLAVYRTRLTDEQILGLHRGQYPKGSLELFAPMNDISMTLNTRLTNLAPTDSYAKINSASMISV